EETLQDNGRADLVEVGLVPAVFFLHPPLDLRMLRQGAREPLVHQVDGLFRKDTLQLVHKFLYLWGNGGVGVRHRPGHHHNKGIDFLPGQVRLQEREYLGSDHCLQGCGDDAQRVRYSKPRSLQPIVDTDQSSQGPGFFLRYINWTRPLRYGMDSTSSNGVRSPFPNNGIPSPRRSGWTDRCISSMALAFRNAATSSAPP